MKVHPVPRKRNITVRFETTAAVSGTRLSPPSAAAKKLRRLPHVFARVLQLPFRADADVEVHDSPGSLRFVAATDDDLGPGVRALPVEIHPGITKVYIEAPGLRRLGIPAVSELELDVWRFRLPESTRPELASAAYEDGELVVTVPKGAVAEAEEEVWGEGFGRLVLVQ